MVDIEQGPLCPFEQYAFAGAHFLVEQETGVGYEFAQLLAIASITYVNLVEVEGFLFKNGL